MKVALAIASFRQNEAVCRLLDRVFDELSGVFSTVIVVDSLGDGGVQAHVTAQGYDGVVVINAEENLGSAGNLYERFVQAEATGADWMYAINHDGEVSREAVDAFIAAARSSTGVGAFYPLRFVPARASYDVTGTQRFPLPFRGTRGADAMAETTAVRWASSNGAFYNLQPFRDGIRPPAEFWMGWEDLAYGWALDAAGWKQLVLRAAPFVDDREYLRRRIFGREVTISDKPAWYAYYSARNFLLVARSPSAGVMEVGTIVTRILLEAGVTITFKPQPMKRLKFMAQGVIDGLQGKGGKWHLP